MDCYFPFKIYQELTFTLFSLKGPTCKGTRAQTLVHSRGQDKSQSAVRSRAHTEAWWPCRDHSLLRGTSATPKTRETGWNPAEISHHSKDRQVRTPTALIAFLLPLSPTADAEHRRTTRARNCDNKYFWKVLGFSGSKQSWSLMTH